LKKNKFINFFNEEKKVNKNKNKNLIKKFKKGWIKIKKQTIIFKNKEIILKKKVKKIKDIIK
jgi:hypothetical protein